MKKPILLAVYTDKFSKRNIETSRLFGCLENKFDIRIYEENNASLAYRISRFGSKFLYNILQYRFSEIHQFKKHLFKKKNPKEFRLSHYDGVNRVKGFPFPKSIMLFRILLFLFKHCPRFGIKIRADFVLITSPQETIAQSVLLYCAKRQIPVVAMINSWDHLTFRGPVLDYSNIRAFIVWNDIQADELRRYHNIDDGRIHKSGAIQFDYLYRVKQKEADDSNELKIDLSKKIIFLPAYHERHGFNEPAVIKHILTHRESIAENFLIVLRPYPKDLTFMDRFSFIRDISNVKVMDIHNNFYEDRRILSLMLKYSNIVLSGPGTVAVEALYFNTPVIHLGIETRPHVKDHNLIKQRFFTDHYQHIMKHEATLFVTNMEDLVLAVKAYFRNPMMHDKERKMASISQVGYCDGKAADRIAAIINDIAFGSKESAFQNS